MLMVSKHKPAFLSFKALSMEDDDREKSTFPVCFPDGVGEPQLAKIS